MLVSKQQRLCCTYAKAGRHVQLCSPSAVRSALPVPGCRQALCPSTSQPSLQQRGLVMMRSVRPDTEEQRSPSDAPQEWEAPMPSKRPDIFPEFEKLDRVVLPKPLPGDPEMPDEELEEAAKRTVPGDPDPEQKPGEAPEPPPGPPSEPNPLEPERKTGGDIPSIPE